MEIKEEYTPYMKEIFAAMPETLFIKDAEGKYAFATRLCDRVNAGDEGTIIGKTDMEIQYDKKLGRRYHEEDMEILKHGIHTHTIDLVVCHGQKFYMEIIKNPIYNDNKEIIGICGICNDVTELMQLREKYEQLSLYDSLTGFYNRNYTAKYDFDNSESLPCSYIICDCNNLKKVNDRYGHKAGDNYICEAAEILKDVVSDKSIVIRWGGDEFLIITPSCSRQVHETLIDRINSSRESFEIKEIKTGLAVGGALRDSLDIPEDEVLKEADKRMYDNKARQKALLN
nr:diguanylate cyclase [uncultured Agathobacter sp.]